MSWGSWMVTARTAASALAGTAARTPAASSGRNSFFKMAMLRGKCSGLEKGRVHVIGRGAPALYRHRPGVARGVSLLTATRDPPARLQLVRTASSAPLRMTKGRPVRPPRRRRRGPAAVAPERRCSGGAGERDPLAGVRGGELRDRAVGGG